MSTDIAFHLEFFVTYVTGIGASSRVTFQVSIQRWLTFESFFTNSALEMFGNFLCPPIHRIVRHKKNSWKSTAVNNLFKKIYIYIYVCVYVCVYQNIKILNLGKWWENYHFTCSILQQIDANLDTGLIQVRIEIYRTFFLTL